MGWDSSHVLHPVEQAECSRQDCRPTGKSTQVAGFIRR